MKLGSIFPSLLNNLNDFDLKTVLNTVSNPIVIITKYGHPRLLLMSDDGKEIIGAATLAGIDFELNSKISSAEWKYRINTLWAKDKNHIIFLFAAVLFKYKNILVDTSILPTPQKIIKKYFEKNTNSDLIIKEVVKLNFSNENSPWLRAGYLPTGIIGNILTSINIGSKLADKLGDFNQLLEKEKVLYDKFLNEEMINGLDSMLETNWLKQHGVDNQESLLNSFKEGRSIKEINVRDSQPPQYFPRAYKKSYSNLKLEFSKLESYEQIILKSDVEEIDLPSVPPSLDDLKK